MNTHHALIALLFCLFLTAKGNADTGESQSLDQSTPKTVFTFSNTLRVVGTYAFYSSSNASMDSSLGGGIDYAYRWENGFVATMHSRYFLQNSGYANNESNNANGESVVTQHILYGLAPGYSIRSNRTVTTLGFFTGGLHTEDHSGSPNDGRNTKTRLAFGPTFAIDFSISKNVAITMGGLFAFTVQKPNPGVNSMNLGISFNL